MKGLLKMVRIPRPNPVLQPHSRLLRLFKWTTLARLGLG